MSLLLSRFLFTVSLSASIGALGSVLDKDFGNYSQQQGFGPEELQPELPLEGRSQLEVLVPFGVMARHVYIVPSESIHVGILRLGGSHGYSHGQTQLQIQLGPQPNCPTGQVVRVMVRHVSRWLGG